MPGLYLVNRTRKIYVCLESQWLHNVRVVSAVLKVGSVETSVDSAVKKFLATSSLEDHGRVLVLRAGRWDGCVVRNLETVEEADALNCGGRMIYVPVYSVTS